MAEAKQTNSWEAVFVPKEAVARIFKSEKTGRELAEVQLPETLPAGAPAINNWHFFMPASCVKETKTGSMRVSFPPSWSGVRFLSPFEKGKRSETMEFPIEDALALLRDSFGNRPKA